MAGAAIAGAGCAGLRRRAARSCQLRLIARDDQALARLDRRRARQIVGLHDRGGRHAIALRQRVRGVALRDGDRRAAFPGPARLLRRLRTFCGVGTEPVISRCAARPDCKDAMPAEPPAVDVTAGGSDGRRLRRARDRRRQRAALDRGRRRLAPDTEPVTSLERTRCATKTGCRWRSARIPNCNSPGPTRDRGGQAPGETRGASAWARRRNAWDNSLVCTQDK